MQIVDRIFGGSRVRQGACSTRERPSRIHIVRSKKRRWCSLTKSERPSPSLTVKLARHGCVQRCVMMSSSPTTFAKILSREDRGRTRAPANAHPPCDSQLLWKRSSKLAHISIRAIKCLLADVGTILCMLCLSGVVVLDNFQRRSSSGVPVYHKPPLRALASEFWLTARKIARSTEHVCLDVLVSSGRGCGQTRRASRPHAFGCQLYMRIALSLERATLMVRRKLMRSSPTTTRAWWPPLSVKAWNKISPFCTSIRAISKHLALPPCLRNLWLQTGTSPIRKFLLLCSVCLIRKHQGCNWRI